MAIWRANKIGILAIFLCSSCSQSNSDESFSRGSSTESGIFDDFRYPERFAALVEKAESGDEESIITLARYYSNFPKTDLRNLEYWSNKASAIRGRDEMTNLIVSLASHARCERAWVLVKANYPNLKEFPFYQSDGHEEAIDGKCRKKV